MNYTYTAQLNDILCNTPTVDITTSLEDIRSCLHHFHVKSRIVQDLIVELAAHTHAQLPCESLLSPSGFDKSLIVSIPSACVNAPTLPSRPLHRHDDVSKHVPEVFDTTGTYTCHVKNTHVFRGEKSIPLNDVVPKTQFNHVSTCKTLKTAQSKHAFELHWNPELCALVKGDVTALTLNPNLYVWRTDEHVRFVQNSIVSPES